MSEQTVAPPASDVIDFEKAEPVDGLPGQSLVCTSCQKPAQTDYYQTGVSVVCASCREQILAALARPPTRERFVLAWVYGAGAALLGALIWGVIRAVTGYDLGLVAVAVGFLVGYAVREGAQRQGGLRYQVLAVFLAYSGVSMSYLPDVISGLSDGSKPSAKKTAASAGADSSQSSVSAPAAVEKAPSPASQSATKDAEKPLPAGVAVILFCVMALALSYAAPILVGMQSVLTLIIVGFALWEAWKMNRRLVVVFEGPFRINPVGTDQSPPVSPPLS